MTTQRAVTQRDRDAAALSYVPPIGLILLFTERDSAFVRFHARQGVLLLLFATVAWFIPYLGTLLLLALLGALARGFLWASAGDWRELPVIGPLSRGSLRLFHTQ